MVLMPKPHSYLINQTQITLSRFTKAIKMRQDHDNTAN